MEKSVRLCHIIDSENRLKLLVFLSVFPLDITTKWLLSVVFNSPRQDVIYVSHSGPLYDIICFLVTVLYDYLGSLQNLCFT